MKAMILAAGLGMRLKPWTDSHPKALVPVNGKSLLERNVKYLMSFGINDIVVNVHHFADQIRDAIIANDAWGANISISDETSEVLETGGGLLHAKALLHDTDQLVLMNADILTQLDLKELIRLHQLNAAIATLAVSERKSSRGFLFDDEMHLSGWQNTSTNEQKIIRETMSLKPFAFSGIHIISTRIFNDCPFSGKFSMVDWYLNIAAQHTIMGYDHTGIPVLDVGKPESVLKAEEMFG